MRWSELQIGEEYCFPCKTEVRKKLFKHMLCGHEVIHPVRRIGDLSVGDLVRFLGNHNGMCSECLFKVMVVNQWSTKVLLTNRGCCANPVEINACPSNTKVAVVSFAKERHSEDTTRGRMFALNMEKESLACRICMNAKTENEEKKMQDTPPIITADFIRKHIAADGCDEPDRFEKDFPRGLPLTHENVVHASEFGHDIRAFFRALGIDYSSGAYIEASIPKIRELQKQVTFGDLKHGETFIRVGKSLSPENVMRKTVTVMKYEGCNYNAYVPYASTMNSISNSEPVKRVKIRIEVEEV